MDLSFVPKGDWQGNNSLLFEDRSHAIDLGITLNPSLTINSQPFRGKLNGEEIFKSICAAYHPNSMPETCKPDFDI